jgi:hypothetical protein
MRANTRVRLFHLPRGARHPHAKGMFIVSNAEADMIRAAFDQGGEFAAAVELRRLFPGIRDNDQARDCARTIAGWKPPLAMPPGKPRIRRPKIRA